MCKQSITGTPSERVHRALEVILRGNLTLIIVSVEENGNMFYLNTFLSFYLKCLDVTLRLDVTDLVKEPSLHGCLNADYFSEEQLVVFPFPE